MSTTPTEPPRKMTGDEYMELLVERQQAHVAAHPPNPSWLVPLYEWFIRDGDEDLVDLATLNTNQNH